MGQGARQVNHAIVGVEFQGRRIIAVMVDETGGVLGRGSVAVTADLAAAAFRTVEAAVADASGGSATPIVSLGVAAHDLSATDCRALLHALATRYPVPFPDEGGSMSGTAAAVAEAWVGAACDARDVVYLAVAEHAAAGVVREGSPLVGATRRAATVAWLALNPVEREDYRRVGCLEAEVAAAGIVRRLVWRIKAGDRSSVHDRTNGDLSAITLEHILDAARQGDGVSISVLRDTAKYLGMAAANLVAITDPAVLVLGGIMASAADLLFEPVRAELARRMPASRIEGLTVRPARLGVEAAAIGAARLAMVAQK